MQADRRHRAAARALPGFLIDQFGVLHDGVRFFDDVHEVREALRRAGATIVTLSNSGERWLPNRERLARIRSAPELYSTLMTAGEVVWKDLLAGGDAALTGLGRRCLFFGRGRDRSAIEGLNVAASQDRASADFVLLPGPPMPTRTRPRGCARALARLPLVCTNPDLVSLGGERRLEGPGTFARGYAAAGGEARYVGKPWPVI